MLTTLLAFIVTLGLLVTIHEYGHYKIAKLCGVKVLRFSVGMGKPIVRWHLKNNETEFVIAALPLGGYVRMADEREAAVAEADKPRAFNNQPLRKRAAVVLAGPVANLLLAVLFFSIINWWGVQQPMPILGTPAPQSLAQDAGLVAGDVVVAAQLSPDDSPEKIQSFDDLNWAITQAVLKRQDLALEIKAASNLASDSAAHWVTLPLQSLAAKDLNAQVLAQIGIVMPAMPAVIRQINEGGAAQQAGLLKGDTVLSVDGAPIHDAAQLIGLIASTGAQATEALRTQQWEVERNGAVQALSVTPAITERDGRTIGFINAQVGQSAYQTTLVRYGFWEGLSRGAMRTWDMSAMTLQMFGRMIIGEASLKNISGPISIAQYAGQSASLGMEQFLYFLAIVSLSLGILNLLPLPVLDGGHLMYYLWEAITGKAVSDVWLDRLQRLGILALLALMSLAVFNDISRLLGS